MTTTQMLITLDDKENKIVNIFASKWKLSKMNTIKQMIKEYEKLREVKNEN